MEIKSLSNVLSFTERYWEWFLHKDKLPYKITGKYLFFCENRKVLKKIAIEEIENNGFYHAKINMNGKNHGTDYVLCLYYKNDSRKKELAEKYKDQSKIKYRYWKSDEDTLRRNYSEEFLSKMSLEERKKWTRSKI